jgi:DNA segregation ATPase FtsK/SpoIIIE, S-DNA-T family
MLVAGRADVLRGLDHWSAPARRHRLGFVMSATSELDGDVLGVTPPRRCPLPPRPGLAWMITHGGCALVQTALAGPAAAVTPG